MTQVNEPWRENWNELKEIGGGGQGATYRANHRTDGTSAVIKVLKKQAEQKARERMFQEVNNLTLLAGEKVPAVLDHNTGDFQDSAVPLYIAMSFIEGVTLNKVITQQKRLSVEDA